MHYLNFRTDAQHKNERDIWTVPIGLLRYRKDNGRIASDISDYETTMGPLDETDDEAQKVIEDFLKNKDPQKTAALRKSIMHTGQSEPAIITCDGFLINGNRRKMVLTQLNRDFPEKEEYKYLEVVALPGLGDPGGPPTLIDIEKLENRYQLQNDGKSEYYGFDRALSIKRKMDAGLSLEEQLRDDPQFANATTQQLEKAIKEYKKEYLEPLECVERYLKQFQRDGHYRLISTGMSDPEGRWQAFKDYSTTFARQFKNPSALLDMGISDDEIGRIEEAAFDIIRLRSIPDMPKTHYIMRELPKLCKHGKKEILKIADEIEPILPAKEMVDENNNPLSSEEIDRKWVTKNRQTITYNLKKAQKNWDDKKAKETPLGLIESALKKLTHDDLDIKKIALADFPKARTVLTEIRERSQELEDQIYHYNKELQKLKNKKQ